MSLFFALLGTGRGGTLGLTAATATDVDSGGAGGGFTFGANGIVTKHEGAVDTEINLTNDWIIPHGAATGAYQIRCINTTAWTTQPVADDTWIDLSEDRTWLFTQFILGGHNLICDFEIRRGGSGSFEVTATFEVDLIVNP